MKLLTTALFALLLTIPAACSDSDKEDENENENEEGSAPTLAAADLPGVSPCPGQTILTDAAEFTTFQAALLNGTFLYLDVPFDGGDADIYRKKCGLGANWDPADNVDEIAPANVPATISDLFVFGNAGICAEGFNNGSFGTGEGLPVAGVYRKEFKVTNAGTTYLVRTRITVAGASAGDTFASLGITVPDDLEDTLGYEVDDVDTDHDDVLTAIASALESPEASVMLDVFDMPGGTLLVSAAIEVLCVEIE